MERCPICRATLGGADICRRCLTDLSKVKALERQAQRLAGEAMLRGALGDAGEAEVLLRRARILQDAPDLRVFEALLRERSDALPNRDDTTDEDAREDDAEQDDEADKDDEAAPPFRHDASGR